MIRHIPAFILEQYERETFLGDFDGFALLFDIADFTKIGTALQKQGKAGAEALSRFLDEVFRIPIATCEEHGGFVSVFAGDAVCILFPDGKPLNVLKAVGSIREHFTERNTFETDFGSFEVKIRQTVVQGEIAWRIFRSDVQNEYVFYGDTLHQMAELSGEKVDAMFSEAAVQAIGGEYFDKLETGYRLRADTSGIEVAPNPLSYSYDAATYRSFLRESLREDRPDNEIRNGAYCFTSLNDVPEDRRQDAIAAINRLAAEYGGFINKLDATDKGLIAILLFGLPRSEGKTLERICGFALEATAQVPDAALGISCGSVFAGYTGSGDTREYTALGHPVNLAARLMSKARAGEALTDSYLQKELGSSFEFEDIGEIQLKGISYPIRHYRLAGRATGKGRQREAGFVGREAEFVRIKDLIEPHLQDKSNLAVYVAGDAGVGKSRLIGEIMKCFTDDQYNTFHLRCDAILAKPLEVIKQLLRQYFHFDPTMEQARGISLFREQWKPIAGDDAELKRIESIIASLLGYEWEGSVWSVLPDNEKPSQQKNALIRFMSELAGRKPVLIHLDDPQWIDDSSKEYLQHLGEKQVAPIVILAACRYTDDGSVPDLELPNCVSETMELSTLSIDGSRSLIASILNLEEVPDATVEAINNKASGNPFFIEQLVAWLKENDHLDETGNLAQELDMSATFGIADVIGSRVDRLTVEVRECVYHASVLGMEFDVAVLSQMLNQEPAPQLEDGARNRIWDVLSEIRYIFSHILIRDIVYQRMMSDRLKDLHRIAAEAMERVYKDDEKALNEHAEEIAGHLDAGQEELKAAEFYQRAGDRNREHYLFERGVTNLGKSIEIRERLLGAEHPDSLRVLRNLAFLYMEHGENSKAETLHLRVLGLIEKSLGSEHPEMGISLNHLATVYRQKGSFELSVKTYRKALLLIQSSNGRKEPETARILNNLASSYIQLGMYEQAESSLLDAMKIFGETVGLKHLDVASALNNLSILYYEQGKYNDAEKVILDSLSITKAQLGCSHPLNAKMLNNLSRILIRKGEYPSAITHFEEALKIRERVNGVEHLDTALLLQNLANAYLVLGDTAQAEPLALRSLSIKEKVVGRDHVETGETLLCLANMFFMQGKFEQAESLYHRTLEIWEKGFGINHPYVASLLNNLANLYFEQGKLKQAEPLWQRSLDIKEKQLGSEHPETIELMSNIAGLYAVQGKLDLAIPLMHQVLDIQERNLGPLHPQIGTFSFNLAMLYIEKDRLDLAEPLLLRAYTTSEQAHGLEHPDTIESIKSLAELYDHLSNPAQAAHYRAMLNHNDSE